MAFFIENREKNPKIHMESQKPLNNQSNYDKEEQSGTIAPHFKLYYNVIVIKTVWGWH